MYNNNWTENFTKLLFISNRHKKKQSSILLDNLHVLENTIQQCIYHTSIFIKNVNNASVTNLCNNNNIFNVELKSFATSCKYDFFTDNTIKLLKSLRPKIVDSRDDRQLEIPCIYNKISISKKKKVIDFLTATIPDVLEKKDFENFLTTVHVVARLNKTIRKCFQVIPHVLDLDTLENNIVNNFKRQIIMFRDYKVVLSKETLLGIDVALQNRSTHYAIAAATLFENLKINFANSRISGTTASFTREDLLLDVYKNKLVDIFNNEIVPNVTMPMPMCATSFPIIPTTATTNGDNYRQFVLYGYGIQFLLILLNINIYSPNDYSLYEWTLKNNSVQLAMFKRIVQIFSLRDIPQIRGMSKNMDFYFGKEKTFENYVSTL